jgi:hypothetical protein
VTGQVGVHIVSRDDATPPVWVHGVSFGAAPPDVNNAYPARPGKGDRCVFSKKICPFQRISY